MIDVKMMKFIYFEEKILLNYFEILKIKKSKNCFLPYGLLKLIEERKYNIEIKNNFSNFLNEIIYISLIIS